MREEWSDQLKAYSKVFVIIEPDRGGETVCAGSQPLAFAVALTWFASKTQRTQVNSI